MCGNGAGIESTEIVSHAESVTRHSFELKIEKNCSLLIYHTMFVLLSVHHSFVSDWLLMICLNARDDLFISVIINIGSSPHYVGVLDFANHLHLSAPNCCCCISSTHGQCLHHHSAYVDETFRSCLHDTNSFLFLFITN